MVLIWLFKVRYWSLYQVYQKKNETLTINPPILIYINRINNRLVFKTKDGYELELQSPEIMILFGSTKKWIEKSNNGENVANLEITEVVSVQCILADNQYR